MFALLPQLAHMTVASAPGTGPVTVSVAIPPFSTLDGAGVVDGQRIGYYLTDGLAWEQGIGTYTFSTKTFARSTVQRSSLGGTTPINASSSTIVSCSSAELTVGAIIGDFYPVVNPSSGNLQGSGTPVQHQVVWSDANPVFWADSLLMTSVDPSAIAVVTIGGTATNGDVLTLTFKWGSNTVSVTHTVSTSETTAAMAAALVAAVQANASLFNAPVSGININGGGYSGGVPIGYIVASGSSLEFNFNGGIGLSMTKAVSGSATETITLPQTYPTPLEPKLDVNPNIQLGRNPGFAPAPNSVLGVIQIVSSKSDTPTTISAQYGQIGLQVLDSTVGALSSRWFFTTPDVNGNYNQAFYFGQGIYTPGATDKGVDTINTLDLWGARGHITNLVGTATNDDATAGSVGEYVSSNIVGSSAVSLTSTVPANITSISLTAGDWEVWAAPQFTGGGTTTVTYMAASLSTVSATMDTSTAGHLTEVQGFGGAVYGWGYGIVSAPIVPVRFSLSATTTIYLVALSGFSVSTAAAFGALSARRVR